MSTSKITVAIDARLPDEGQGGVQQVIVSLADALSRVNDQNFHRTWIVFEGTTWWQGIFPSEDEIVIVPAPFGGISLKLAKLFPKLLSRIYPIVAKFLPQKPFLDEILKSKNVDLVHVPFQDGIYTNLPFVFNPHDLQHVHYPNFFRNSQIEHRNTIWKRTCERANLVLSASPMVTRDLINHWGIESSKIRLVPIPPPTRTPDPTTDTSNFPQEFCIYPAVFWPHKNHLNLIKAWSILRESGYEIPLLFTGAATELTEELRKEADKLGLSGHIIFAGHVSNQQLTALLLKARVVVIPSLFEAMSLTLWDAQRLGTPVACSNVDPFPLQVGNTALMFNPLDPADIAEKVTALLENTELREKLIRRANQNLLNLTSYNYGMAMLGIYLECANREQTAETRKATTDLVSVIEKSIDPTL